MDETNKPEILHYNRQGDLPETHRYARSSLTDQSNSGAIKKMNPNELVCQGSPAVKRKLQVTIDPSAFVKPTSNTCTPLCKRKLDGTAMLLRDKNSGSFPNTPQAFRRAEIAQGMLSVSNSPVVSRRSELMSESSMHGTSPLLSRRSELLFDSASSSAASSPLLVRREKAFGSPARSIGEPGVFSSPAHSVGSISLADDDCDDEDFELPTSDQTIVAGWLKFRDNKRWKQRWGVVTKLSPAADCLHLQLYRDSKDRYKKGQTKASLSLQHFLGFESGFTLDKESNTIAIICQDVIVVLAFDTRERLIQWQVKISSNLGEGQQFLVLVSSAPPKTKAATGPAKLHVQDHKFCLTAGVPPRLIGIWEIVALRRYGVVEGRFCFEGGSRCGKGEGLHVLITDQGEDITHTFTLASQGKLSTKKRTLVRKMSNADSPKKQMSFRPETRLSDLTSTQASDMSRSQYGDENCCNRHHGTEGTDGAVSPYWPSMESQMCHHHGDIDSNYGCGDTSSVSEMQDAVHHDAWASNGPNGTVTLERCMSCISKLGAMSRSSTVTAAMTPCAGSHFHPAWTMESVKEKDRNSMSSRNSSGGSTEYSTPRMINVEATTPSSPPQRRIQDVCNCPNCPPARPPKMLPLSNSNNQCFGNKVKKAPMPLPAESACMCQQSQSQSKVGPYENYDVPKMHFQEDLKVSNKLELSGLGEHYDTPKKIKECLAMDNIFQLTKSNLPGVISLQKPCGCILKLGRRQPEPTIVDCDDIRPPDCPCQRVTNWANNLICRKPDESKSNNREELALYATVDVSKKANRRNNTVTTTTTPACICQSDESKTNDGESDTSSNYVNIDPSALLPEETNADPTVKNYANLDFAHSLEYYENAKDMLKRAGITQDEMEALQNSLNSLSQALDKSLCNKCGHHQNVTDPCPRAEPSTCTKNDDYLLMKPASANRSAPEKCQKNVSGYTPMSPAATVTLANKTALKCRVNRLIVEKSASNPTLFGPPVDRSRKRSESEMRIPGSAMVMMLNSPNSPYTRKQIMDSTDSIELLKNRKRSSSADSSRYLEDLKEFDSVSSRTTSSSLETLRNISIDNRRSSSPCIHQEIEHCEDKKCCTNVQYEVKSMDTDGDVTPNGIPVLRKKGKEMSHIRRSSSVPCKSGPNRDSSSSNDSGVSTCSLKHHGADFAEFELPLTTSMSSRRHNHALAQRQAKGSHPDCLHSSLPRKSKSSDPLRDLTFQFQKIIIPAKSSSAEAEVPVCPPKAVKGVIDSHSSSSGASDMSDYIETLSMSSHSSSDTPETLRINRQATNTLRPRSGKEYHSIDQTMLTAHPTDARITGWI